VSRVVFGTGKAHQENAAIWARQRLADGAGRGFLGQNDQDGVLFADGVGLGKTWEALGAAALILYKAGPKAGRRHVMILCPPNLVSKWADELAAGSPFRARLARWQSKLEATGNGKVARRVVDTLSHVLPIRSSSHVRTKRRYGKFRPPGGTYIVSQSLITTGGRGLSPLLRENWDVTIVDEAHNATARKALAALQGRRRAHTKLLLSATPFQLEPTQWNGLAKSLLKGSPKVLKQADIACYIDLVADVFESPSRPGPTPKQVAEASRIFRCLAARTIPRVSRRTYRTLMLDGTVTDLAARLDELDDVTVREFLARLGVANEPKRDHAFEVSYVERRLELATATESTFVATQLRRMLAAGIEGNESPRRRALQLWATRTLEADIRDALRTGHPRKTVVFTSWVGEAATGEASALKRMLESCYATAIAAARRHAGPSWKRWQRAGADRLRGMAGSTDVAEIGNALEALASDEMTSVLAGKHSRFSARLANSLKRRAEAITQARSEYASLTDRYSFEARSLKRRLYDLTASLSPWTTGAALGPVERYTGRELRSARDRAATAFRELGPPWVLVASNVGSEGIDLHTYTARIVHYDLEWNPAKMEQREGRGDRVGRLLKGNLEILYCLVPRTYDERMFHQLVARDRWHGVLLGKPASKLDNEDKDAPLMDRKRLEKMRLDLAPPRIR
jgi:superfamily II DNA or RNA helicase